ncbi:nitrilase family protein [bacterium]|nr:nitrilase family protein [bacterium]
MKALRLALVQDCPLWEQPEANLARLETRIRGIRHADLIVLPELFSTGFSMHPERFGAVNETLGLTWMQRMSLKTGAALCGSLAVPDAEGGWRNRLYFVEGGSVTAYYDKRHSFGLAGEQRVYRSGNRYVQVRWRSWNIALFVCYDLRFPAWCRQTDVAGTPADMMVFVANWPQKRIEAWTALLRARAIENQCFVAGVNRVGPDGNDVAHNGQSALVDYAGRTVVSLSESEGVLRAALSLEPLRAFRGALPFLEDRDRFTFST